MTYKILNKKIIIAGPCAIESEYKFKSTLDYLLDKGIKYIRVGLHKPRTSPNSFQGVGSKYYDYITSLKDSENFCVVSEILSESQFNGLDQFVDIFQVGSRNMQNFGLLKFLSSNTKKKILLKRGMSSTVQEFLAASSYLKQIHTNDVYLCLRGIRTFEQIDSDLRNTPDLGTILELKKKTSLPIIYDPSHSTGKVNYILPISKAAILFGVDGLIVETSISPETALCDSKQILNKKDFEIFIQEINDFYENIFVN